MKRVRLDPAGPFKRDPLPPHRMIDRVTAAEDVVVLCHLGVPRIERDEWSLSIDGMVECPLTLGFQDLRRYPPFEVASVHECCGNPLKPFEPMRRAANVRWGGVRLADVLADCRPAAAARYLWSFGADWGQFGGVDVEAFGKDLPLERARADVLLAHTMNGEPLTAEHGFPVRLVVPGFYGTNSVKWLTRLTLAEGRSEGAFTTRWYNDPEPVWAIAPESLIVSPKPEESVAGPTEIRGWAWADGGVRAVEVRTDGWRRAELEPTHGRQWQRFSLVWEPVHRGAVALAARAQGTNGDTQPTSGRRNAIFEVPVNVL